MYTVIYKVDGRVRKTQYPNLEDARAALAFFNMFGCEAHLESNGRPQEKKKTLRRNNI